MKQLPSVAIVGGGLAGLTCAVALRSLLPQVKIFEKEVFPGGRVGRMRLGDYEFNHGAQHITVTNPVFWNIVSGWQNDGIVRAWDDWVVELKDGQFRNVQNEAQRFVGIPRMQVIAENLARHCDIDMSTGVGEIEKQDDGSWRLFNDRGVYLGAYDIVVIATTANQVPMLCPHVPEIAEQAEKVRMTVSWIGMFAFEEPLELPFQAASVLNSPLSWISRHQLDGSTQEADCWVVQATAKWSLEHAASFRGRVLNSLLDAFWQATLLEERQPLSSTVHCWKHALPLNPIAEDALFVESKAIGACGDWCTSPKIEGAVLSGFSMADRIMKFVNRD